MKSNKIIKMTKERGLEVYNVFNSELKDTIEAKYSTSSFKSVKKIIFIIINILKKNQIDYLLDLTSNIGGDLYAFIYFLNPKNSIGIELNKNNFNVLKWNFNILINKNKNKRNLSLQATDINLIQDNLFNIINNNTLINKTNIILFDPPWGGGKLVNTFYESHIKFQSLYLTYKGKTLNIKCVIIKILQQIKKNHKILIYVKLPFTYNISDIYLYMTKYFNNFKIYPIIHIEYRYIILLITNYKVSKQIIKNFGININILNKLEIKNIIKNSKEINNIIKNILYDYNVINNNKIIKNNELFKNKYTKNYNRLLNKINNEQYNIKKKFYILYKLIQQALIFDKYENIITYEYNFNIIKKFI